MVSFFERLMGRRSPSSAKIAKERLKLVLVTDRSNLPQEKLEEMQAEIIGVIKRYIEIDEPQVDIKIEQRERQSFLVADIPLFRDKSYKVASENAPPPGSLMEEPPVSSEDTIPHQPPTSLRNPGDSDEWTDA